MSYNQGKTFDIHAEIDFFLGEAMSAASAVADKISLTDNNHVMNPEYGQIYGWNPYFEMFSQPSLANVPEVLLWKQYNKSLSITHDAPNRLQVGDDSGLMHSFITAFLCKDGLPIMPLRFIREMSASMTRRRTVTNACDCLSGEKAMYSSRIRLRRKLPKQVMSFCSGNLW